MIKHILFALCFASLSLYGQVGSGVQIDLNAPENVVAGSNFEVTITLTKGNLKDYSRFSQELPAGFTASNISSPNADFTFDEERIRIIWLKLPDEEEIEVKYSIGVHQRLSGTLELGGVFAYVADGERKFLEITDKKQIVVMPSPDIDQSLVVDISDFKSIFEGETPATESKFATVIRQEPVIQQNGVVLVSLLVHKPEGTKYLKLEETIPGGYSFEAIQTNRAIVSQAASIAKFVWMKPPDESLFIMKYRLVPILEQEQQALLIQGTITYTEGDQNMVEEIEELSVAIDGLTSAQQLELLKTGIVSSPVAEITKVEPVTKTVKQAEVKTDEVKKAVATTRKTESKSKDAKVLSIPSLSKQEGVYFRVQVAAIRNPYFANVYFGGYDILQDVKVEQLDGWYKYTVGSMTDYREAEDLKTKIRRNTPVKTAFVVAYKDGKRIPMKDAL
ncbi:hypothetical protein ACFLQX_02090 [Bacteroidota bacterium]